MSGEIGGVSERAQSSAEAAPQATHNTQAVAAVAEQLAASVHAIRRQVHDCRVARPAVGGEVGTAANHGQALGPPTTKTHRRLGRAASRRRGDAYEGITGRVVD